MVYRAYCQARLGTSASYTDRSPSKISRRLRLVRIRRPPEDRRRTLPELVQHPGDRPLELGIVPVDDVLRGLLHRHIGRNPDVLNYIAGVGGPNRQIGCGDTAAIHQDRRSENPDQAAPRSLADQRPDLLMMEHPREHSRRPNPRSR